MALALTAKKREVGNAEELRGEGMIPAILYGSDLAPQSIVLDYGAFSRVYAEGGESTLVDLAIDGGESTTVLIQALQYHPVTDLIMHVDLRRIAMNEEMTATVELEFVGEAAAVKTLGGTLLTQLETLDIKCLPKNLVSSITVDLSSLKTFDDAIHVKDLVLPTGITADADPETLIAKVAEPLSEDELKAMDEIPAVDVSKIEVEKKGKKEEEATADAK